MTGRNFFLGFISTILMAAAFIGSSQARNAENLPPYKNHKLDMEVRIEDLVSRMTLEEKVSQMVYDAPAIERLNIPAYNWWNEALHGVARSGLATVFPQAIGLAATWDTDLLKRAAAAISDEARAKYHEYIRQGKRGIYQGLTFWSPNINIFRDPRWGRGMETFGEDPYLTGRLAAAFVRGMQGDDPLYLKTVATPKHFAVHSGPEPDRHTFDARVSEYDLRETYLPAFKVSIREGGARSVMCAYNRFRGEACCGSNLLLKNILRGEWGFSGYVVSDCWAIHDIFKNHKIVETGEQAAALAVRSGTDLNCGDQYPKLVNAVRQGLLTEEEIDTAVKRLFRARFKLGMFDPDEKVPYANIPYKVVDCQKHRDLALEAAKKSIVLLKNEKPCQTSRQKILPLSKDIKTIAVIGPNADDIDVLLGNYNGYPANPITPLKGIKEKVSPRTRVIYARGCDAAENIPCLEVVPGSVLFTSARDDRQPGLKGEYFDNRDFKGEPVLTRIDRVIDFNWWDGAPLKGLDDDNFAVRWTGIITPPVSGRYALGARGFNGFRFYFADRLIAELEANHMVHKRFGYLDLEAGRAYQIRLEFREWSRHAEIQLIWCQPDKDLQKAAIQAARQADAAILFMGLSPRLEGEEMEVQVKGFLGGDRLALELPEPQVKLIRAIYEQVKDKPLVLVLLNGSALAIPWEKEHMPAILEAWYPGQAAGTAIADVIFGDYNPAGRLPVSFYTSAEQLPRFQDYQMKGRTYRYFQGNPLFAFGCGLSYTTFKYRHIKIEKDKIKRGEQTRVWVDVTNTGQVSGEEVVQLYIRDNLRPGPNPNKTLKDFLRIELAPGQTRRVAFDITPEKLSFYDEKSKGFIVAAGEFTLMIGPSSKDEDLQNISLRVVD